MYIIKIPANLAQLVEQLIRNEQVIGSSPIIGSIFFAFFSLFRSIIKKSQDVKNWNRSRKTFSFEITSFEIIL